MKELLIKILDSYSDFLSPKDLVALGLYKSLGSIRQARRRGRAPYSIKLSNQKTLYPKLSVIEFLRNGEAK